MNDVTKVVQKDGMAGGLLEGTGARVLGLVLEVLRK